METQLDDIKAIRSMMERSSKFLSLSGLSGLCAGLTSIAGAAVAYFYILNNTNGAIDNRAYLLIDALLVLVVSISFAVFFSWRKAKKAQHKLFNSTTKTVLYHLGVPLVAGGIFSLVFLLRGDIFMVQASTLVFYGLALINASKFTYDEIHYLGLTEIALGIILAICGCNGLLVWTLGFGVCHIIYGTIMYLKYDRK